MGNLMTGLMEVRFCEQIVTLCKKVRCRKLNVAKFEYHDGMSSNFVGS